MHTGTLGDLVHELLLGAKGDAHHVRVLWGISGEDLALAASWPVANISSMYNDASTPRSSARR